MGADQIGYLVKGPLKIPARRIKAAVSACKRWRRELLDQAGEDAEEDRRKEATYALTAQEFDPLEIPEDPKEAIRRFVDWWNGMESWDTCSRTDPDQPSQKLVYAGEMSWGDEPDGEGYRMLRRAFAWGFVDCLGIR